MGEGGASDSGRDAVREGIGLGLNEKRTALNCQRFIEL